MKPLIFSLVFVALASPATAQVELKLNASFNATWLPDFKNRVYIVDGFITPNVISIANARNPPVVLETNSKTRAHAGFQVEAEIGKKLNERWKLSFALGCMQMSYDYVTYIPQSFYGNDLNLLHGNTRFTYISARPVNISFTRNRFSFQAGPVLGWLVGKNYTNAVVIYDMNTFKATGAFIEEEGQVRKLLYGAHLNTRFAVGRRIGILLGSQYFFNPIFKDIGAFTELHSKSKAFQMQLGLSYTLKK